MYVFYYLSTSELLSFIISYSDKHEFSSIWKWLSCSNDVMNHVDCIVKLDDYPQKMHSCSKNLRCIFFCSKNNRGISRKNIYQWCYCMGIPLVER